MPVLALVSETHAKVHLNGELRAKSRVGLATCGARCTSRPRLDEAAPGDRRTSPARYRRRGVDLALRFTCVPTELGWLLIAGTDRGLSVARFGPSPEALERSLREDFPRAELRRDEAGLEPWARALRDWIAGRSELLDLPLDVVCTAFQARVFELLRRLPRGTTTTYGQLARELGLPRGARAVGQAVAANPVALVVPCHRVLPATGGVGGYRWGAERKRRLLALEASGDGGSDDEA